MSVASFIKNKFIGQKVCLSLNDGKTETLMYADSWVQNREYFEGIAIDVEEDIITLQIDGGNIYINAEEVTYFWQKPIDPRKAMKMSLTNKFVQGGT